MEETDHIHEETADDVVGFLQLVSTRYSPQSGEWVYRGQSNHELPLVSRGGRLFPKRLSKEALSNAPDLKLFYDWRNKAVAYCPELPENELECLAFAQHYGLATRLLDWTANPLVSLFFAVEHRPDEDGAVFLYRPPTFFMHYDRKKQVSLVDLDFDGVMVYTPPPFDKRILAQSARFSFHPNPSVPLTENIHGLILYPIVPRLAKIRIRAELKKAIRSQLNDIGVNRVALFPDADGLSEHMNWQTMH